MSRQVLYVAAPLRPTSEQIAAGLPRESWIVGLDEWRRRYPEDVRRHEESCLRANLDRAMRWLAWLRRSFPETTFIAPWIAAVLSGEDDANPVQREAGLVDDCAVVERCDGIVLVGGRISERMRREMEHGIQNGHRYQGSRIESFKVYDLTPTRIDNWIRFPTWSVLEGPGTFASWYAAIVDMDAKERLETGR